MAINVGQMLGSFSQAELKNIASQAAQGVAGALASRPQGMRQQADLPKSRLMGGTADLPFLATSALGSVGNLPARLMSRQALTGIRMGTGLGANVAGGVEGEAFSAIVGEATAGFQSLVNVLTVPNISNFSTFMEHVSTAPQKMEKFGEALLKSRQELAKFSPEYALAQAEMTVGDILRKQESAQRTGGSALELARGLESLKDTLQPLRDELFNLSANLITDLIPYVEDVANQLKDFFPAFKAFAELGVSLFELMLTVVPWQELQGALEVLKVIAEDANFLTKMAKLGADSPTLAIMLDSMPGIVGDLRTIARYVDNRLDRAKLEDLAKLNEKQAGHSQDIIKELLQRDPYKATINDVFMNFRSGLDRGTA